MDIFVLAEGWIRSLSTSVSIEWFVLLGSIAEEVLSPIPAMLVTGLAGSLALLRGESWWYIGVLAALASCGKTIGAGVYYFIGDKLEHVLVRRIGRWIGVTHEDIEKIGRKFTGHHWKDGGALFLVRVVPFLPTTPFSIACGIFKMDWRVFLVATFSGYAVKDIGYISFGYFGIAALETAWRDLAFVKQYVDVIVGILLVWFFIFLYEHRHRGRHAWHFFCRFFDKK